MEISLDIETFANHFENELLDSNSLSKNTEKTLGEGVSIRYGFSVLRKSLDIPQWFNIILVVGQNVALPLAVNLFSNYLYDKLVRRKIDKVIINHSEVRTNREEIEELIRLIMKEREG